MIHLKVDTLPDPSDRFTLGDEIATGSWAKVIHFILVFGVRKLISFI